MTPDQVCRQAALLPGWEVTGESRVIRRTYAMKDFLAAVDFVREIALLAESEGHHPDIHLIRYRILTVELSTHALGGLTENDFILAAKIDALPKKLKA